MSSHLLSILPFPTSPFDVIFNLETACEQFILLPQKYDVQSKKTRHNFLTQIKLFLGFKESLVDIILKFLSNILFISLSFLNENIRGKFLLPYSLYMCSQKACGKIISLIWTWFLPVDLQTYSLTRVLTMGINQTYGGHKHHWFMGENLQLKLSKTLDSFSEG